MRNYDSTGGSLKFSLVVATKNRITEVEELLNSLVSQTYGNFETVIVDQNEDNRLVELIVKYSSQLNILHIKTETGLSKARNAGLKLVSGDIVAFPDDDCTYPGDLLNMLKNSFFDYPDVDGIAGSLTETLDIPIKERIVVVNKKNIWKTIKSATIFLRKDVIIKTGLFDENLGIGSPAGLGAGEETDYLLRAIDTGFSIVQITAAKIIHPPIIKDYSQWRKVFSYTKGSSYVLRKYRFPVYIFLYQIVRPIMGIVLFGLLLQRNRVRYYCYSLKGKINGYFYQWSQ